MGVLKRISISSNLKEREARNLRASVCQGHQPWLDGFLRPVEGSDARTQRETLECFYPTLAGYKTRPKAENIRWNTMAINRMTNSLPTDTLSDMPMNTL